MDHDDFQRKPSHGDDRDNGGAALEARLVAWLLGEASAFEAAELERLVATHPALAAFKRRIEAVHGLLGEAAGSAEADTLRLGPERRARLLEQLATAGVAPVTRKPDNPAFTPAVEPAADIQAGRPRWWVWLVFAGPAVASVVMVMAVGLLAMMTTLDSKRRSHLLEMELSSAEDVEVPMLSQDLLEDVPWAASVAPAREVQLEPRVTSGVITTPIHRNVGSSRSAPIRSKREAPKQRDDVHEGDLTEDGSFHDEIVVLSPFEIRGEPESAGYAATSTLAGTRMSTGTTLSDLSSNVEARAGGAGQSSFRGLEGAALSEEPANAQAVWSAGFGSAAGSIHSPAPGAPARHLDRGSSLRGERPDTQTTGFDYVDSAPKRPNPQQSPGGKIGRDDAAPASIAAATTAPEPNSSAKPTPLTKEKKAAETQDKDLLERRKSPKPPPPPAVDEAHAGTEPVSTFSLHVSDVSFRLAQAALGRGQLPDAASIRPEEFYNAFDYGDPSPSLGEKVSCRIEQAAHPFLQQRNLVRVAMKVAATGRGAGQSLRLTILLDTSGSMERDDRAASVRRAMEVLSSLLKPEDRVTLIGFARQPRLLAEAVSGDQARRLLDIVTRTPAQGGTNMEEALNLADALARRHFDAAAQNRIVLLTDGAANLGDADPEKLAARISALRTHGVAFDACGVGTDGLDDEILEALTRQGDGRYYVLDSPDEADAGFARQLAGAFRPAARNVKVQVRFNPARVGAYRLLGFEKHRLREQDFRNDKVDAAELAAEEAAVAVYQVEVLPEGSGELGDVFVRFQDTASGTMVERSWTIGHDARAPSFDRASHTVQLAGTAALTAEVLRGGALADQIDLARLAPTVSRLRSRFAEDKRVQDLGIMFDQLRRITNR